MPGIKPARICVLQPLHARYQVRFPRLDQKVIVVAHQHPGVDPPASLSARFAQHLEEQLPVVIASEDLFSTITPCHDVIEGTGILNANVF